MRAAARKDQFGGHCRPFQNPVPRFTKREDTRIGELYGMEQFVRWGVHVPIGVRSHCEIFLVIDREPPFLDGVKADHFLP